MNAKYIFTLFLFFTCMVSQKAKAQTTEQDLVGIWIFDLETTKLNMNDESKAYFNKLEDSKKNRIYSHYQNRELVFHSDGKYIKRLPDGREISGSWLLANQTINISLANNFKKKLFIKTIDANRLVIMPGKQGNGKPVFTEWHLTKKKP